MTQTMDNRTTAMQTPNATAAACCAVAAFILSIRTLSLALGVLLILAVVLCGVLISLALTRRTPRKEQAR